MTGRYTYPEDTPVSNVLLELVLVLEVGSWGDNVRAHLLRSEELLCFVYKKKDRSAG